MFTEEQFTFRNGTLSRRRSPIWPASAFPKFLLIVTVRFVRCGALTVDDLTSNYLLEVGARWWVKSLVICSSSLMAFSNGDLRRGRLLLVLVHNCSCNLSHCRPSNSFWLWRYGAANHRALWNAGVFHVEWCVGFNDPKIENFHGSHAVKICSRANSRVLVTNIWPVFTDIDL